MKNRPTCCGTHASTDIKWDSLGLVPGHAYTLVHLQLNQIDGAVLIDTDGQENRIVKLRNPWGKVEWLGRASENDSSFWNSIVESREKKNMFRNMGTKNEGMFLMTFEDYCQYFSQTHFCLVEDAANYLSEDLYPSKNGAIFELDVEVAGEYDIEIHQPDLRGESAKRIEEGLCRGTLILGRRRGTEYEFVDATLKYYEEDINLNVDLERGRYIIYAKLDATAQGKQLPNRSSISLYSNFYANLKRSEQSKHRNFLEKCYYNYAEMSSRKQEHNGGKMWISWKLLFKKGGYAYFAFHNDRNSSMKYVLTFDEK